LFPNAEPVLVAYSGGVFGSRILLGRFRDRASQAGVRVLPPVYPAAIGALLEAYRVAGVDIHLK